jgi:ComF family protein
MPTIPTPLASAITAWRGAWSGAVGHIFPNIVEAELAQARETGWKIDLPQQYCRRCGATMAEAGTTARGCAFCARQVLAWDRIVRLGSYREPLSPWILAMKFRRSWGWAPWFGRELAAAAGAPGRGADRTIVCPVPLHLLRRWGRGYDQAHLIASAFARQRGLKLVPLLRRVRYTRPQTTLPASARIQNVAAAFALRPVDLTDYDIWLIDDVRTTGATLSACSRLLRRAGARRIHAAVVAVADPRSAGFTAL